MNAQEETMIYKRLFNIHYKGKKFTIFIDKYGRKTFLQLDDSGNYSYPMIDDFVELHKIYNERDIFVSYDATHYNIGEGLPIYRDPRTKFKENVRIFTEAVLRVSTSMLAALLLVNATSSRTFKLVKQDDRIEIVPVFFEGKLITDTSELDSVLGYKSVTLEDIISVVNKNDKIGEPYKEYAIGLAKYMYNKYPNTDGRIFFENMKRVLVKQEKKSVMGEHVAGTYNSLLNKVSIREDYSDKDEVILHEFAHSYHHWKENTLFLPSYRVEEAGISLDEAATNRIIGGLLPTTTYGRELRVFDYLRRCVGYDYYDYERGGISKLIGLLKEKYPDVDIDYIIDSVDAMYRTLISTDEDIRLEESLETLDEMFKICISNIDLNSDSIYQPYMDFLRLIIDYDASENMHICNDYLKRYNAVLLDKGYSPDKIEENSRDFTYDMHHLDFIKVHLWSCFSRLDVGSFEKDDTYGAFKAYLDFGTNSCISNGETKNFFYDVLDMYNNILYCNGYKRDDTVTSDEVRSRIEKFKGINITGYVITNDDVLHPIIDIGNDQAFYNKETKIPTLNEQGKIVLLDKADIKTEKVSDNNSPQFGFIRGFFDNIEKESFEFDENYWQDVFELKSYEYKKFPLYLDGEQVADEYLKDLSVLIGNGEDGANTFELIKDEQATSQEVDDPNSAVVPMELYISTYLQSNRGLSSIELNDLFNKDYLKMLISDGKSRSLPAYILQNFSFLHNFTYDEESDTITVHPIYTLTMEGEDKQILMQSVNLHLGTYENYLLIGGEHENMDDKIMEHRESSTVIPFEKVLDHYEILQEDKQDYHFSKQEIVDLYCNYVSEVSNNNASDNKLGSSMSPSK